MTTRGSIKKYFDSSVKSDQQPFVWDLSFSGDSKGKPLVWLHGFMGSAEDWEDLVVEHFPEFQNILVNLPGHGGTEIPGNTDYTLLLKSLIDQLRARGYTSCTPVAYSMGGRIALHLQKLFPDYVTAMMLISSAPGLKSSQEQQERIKADASLMDNLDQSGFASFLKKWYELPLFGTLAHDNQTTTKIIQARSNNSPDQLRKSLELLGNGALPSLWNHLQNIHIPLLLLSGAEDAKYCEINREMSQLLPECFHKIIPEAGHAIHIQKPLETAHIMRQFLSELIEGV